MMLFLVPILLFLSFQFKIKFTFLVSPCSNTIGLSKIILSPSAFQFRLSCSENVKPLGNSSIIFCISPLTDPLFVRSISYTTFKFVFSICFPGTSIFTRSPLLSIFWIVSAPFAFILISFISSFICASKYFLFNSIWSLLFSKLSLLYSILSPQISCCSISKFKDNFSSSFVKLFTLISKPYYYLIKLFFFFCLVICFAFFTYGYFTFRIIFYRIIFYYYFSCLCFFPFKFFVYLASF